MSLINVNNLTFGYDGSAENIFEDVNFQIDTNWKLGFIARNGKGKTTFLKLLMNQLEYTGKISSSVDFEYFPYDADEDWLTIDIIREISPQALDWEIIRELSLLDVSDDVLYRQFKTLSNGEQTKAKLAAMFLRENVFLLIDEPTNHLDTLGRAKVSEYLSQKKGFILVSHDRDFLDKSVDHILSINKNSIEIQKGNFSSWNHNKELQMSFEQSENQKLERDISRLKKGVQSTHDWSNKVEKSKQGVRNSGLRPDTGFIGHKSAKMMKRSKSLDRRRNNMLSDKENLLNDLETVEDLKISPLKFHTNQLITLENVVIKYSDRQICEPVNFTIEQGEKVALTGVNGCGKSSILKLICGEDIPYDGKIIKNDRLKISYISQSTEHLKGNLDEFCQQNQIDESLFRTILRKLDFSREQFEKPIESYSAGQKKKVALSGSLCQQAHLYIWDEPLNFIDVISRIQIENLLEKYQPSILFVEHDSAFCRKISTKTIEIDKA